MTATVKCLAKNVVEEESEEDKELQADLKLLVDRICGKDSALILPSIEMMKYLIRTATTSMTSVPKPLKYLAPYYLQLKNAYETLPAGNAQKGLADVISVLAMGTAGGDIARKQHDCLKFCLKGTLTNIGDWGHEYIRNLENEIVQQWSVGEVGEKSLMPLIKDIVKFDFQHHAEIQACDLLAEIDKLDLLLNYINSSTYQRVCLYLMSCTKYVDDVESRKITKMVCEQYLKYGEYSRSLIAAIQMKNKQMVDDLFSICTDKVILLQMAFICARHLYSVELDPNIKEVDELQNVLNNSHLSNYFLTLVRELDILEPKTPEEVYKTWLEPTTSPRYRLMGETVDSAKQNLASSFVNGFVNAGFGRDKLLTEEGGNKSIYKNKDHGMISATATLGLLHLWDVDGGLTPIDKYLYTSEDYIRSGALLALGIVNCRIRNECDPALALLGDYIAGENTVLQTGAIFGLGLAYAGSNREDVLDLLLPALNSCSSVEILGITALSCGLISLGKSNTEAATAILDKIMLANNTDSLKSPFMTLAGLGVALCYYAAKQEADVPIYAIEVLDEPFKSMMHSMLYMCAYAGSGDVLIVQELLETVGERIEPSKLENNSDSKLKKDIGSTSSTTTTGSNARKDGIDAKLRDLKKRLEWDYAAGQAMATLAVAAVSFGEETGMEMVQRIFGHVGRYGDNTVRKAAPLAIALTSISNPELPTLDVLTKYSHDSDDDVACNGIFGLGLIGAGTNNARLAACLRQLAVYHSKKSSQLFMVRIAQGLVHMGKGTLTLNPMHTDRQLIDPVGMAGVLITLVSLLKPQATILGKAHYLMFSLVTAMHPRWLLTLNENLEPTPVTVRVGQAVDVVAKAGTPKTIAGIHTHTTPVLLATGERAELATDEFEVFAPTLDGICVLKKKE